ncbi:uncharacterized protein LOC113312228 [Papaver somniferum]|uniref:uncharacterized protein LOC113312228 n=1 Tax=Papaver somniferum TaxID=3469 RepID=UPI000E701D70|nr:uncharacterized protein LOC113312228 [Papaver somniferum]
MNLLKCAFGVTSGKFLGFVVTNKGIQVDQSKVEAIMTMVPPTNAKDLQAFIGRISYMRRFVPGLAQIMSAFFPLLRKGTTFKWEETQQVVFEKLKKCLVSAQVLKPPIKGVPLYLYTAFTSSAIGAVLAQDMRGNELSPIYYVSRVLRDAELRYPRVEQACLALIYATQKLRPYLLTHKTIVVAATNHIAYLASKPVLTRRTARWLLQLSEFELDYQRPKGVRGQAIADLMSMFPGEGDDETHDRVPGEVAAADINKPWTINNVAEYEALILGLIMAKELGLGGVEIKGDSRLVTNQVNGYFHVKEPHLALYRAEAQNLISQTGSILDHTSRGKNKNADALATLVSKLQLTDKEEGTVTVRRKELANTWKEDMAFEEADDWRRTYIDDLTKTEEDRVIPTVDGGSLARCVNKREEEKILQELHATTCGQTAAVHLYRKLQRRGVYWPSISAQAAALQDICAYCQAPPQPAEVCTVDRIDWRQPYMDFIQNGKLSSDRQAALKIQKKTARFFMHEGILYRRSYSNAMLRCLSDEEAAEVMTRSHNTEHQGMRKLFLQLYEGGFYWPTMESDTTEHLALDIIGQINPMSSKRHKYIITATEYTTKWVEAIPLKDYAGATVAAFIKEYIICRFGAPMIIRADNAKSFVNKDVIDLLRQYNVRLHTSTPYYPQGNGQAEASNKTFIRILSRILSRTVEDHHREWYE